MLKDDVGICNLQPHPIEDYHNRNYGDLGRGSPITVALLQLTKYWGDLGLLGKYRKVVRVGGEDLESYLKWLADFLDRVESLIEADISFKRPSSTLRSQLSSLYGKVG